MTLSIELPPKVTSVLKSLAKHHEQTLEQFVAGLLQDEVDQVLYVQQNPDWTEGEIGSYKRFIDGLLGWPRSSVMARRVREWGTNTPKTYCLTPEFEELMSGFTAEQRSAIADLLQGELEAGIQAVLAYFDDGPWKVYEGDKPLPHKPFYEYMHSDWMSRLLGFPWPDEERHSDKGSAV